MYFQSINKPQKTTESYQAELLEVNPNLKATSEYKSMGKIIKIKCVIHNYEWDTTPIDLKKHGYKCPKCEEDRLVKEKEEFINELHQINPDIILIGEFKNRTAKTTFKCNLHEYEWDASPRYLLKSGKCPKCSGTYKKTIEEFKNELKIVNPNIEVLEKGYEGRSSSMLVKCLKCGTEWDAKASNLLKGTGCISCSKTGRTKL